MPSQESKSYIDGVVEDLIDRLNTPLSIEIPAINLDATSPILRGKPIAFKDVQETPGFFETTAKRAWTENEFVNLGKSALNTISEPFYDDEVPEGWTAYEEKNIADLPDKYWGYIVGSKSPKDLAYRRERAMQEVENQNYLASGGILPNLIGGGVGFMTSPSTYIIPWIAAAKYAKVGQHVLKGVATAAPSIIGQTAIHETIRQGASVGPSAEEMALDTIRDSLFGLAFVGVGKFTGFGAKATDVWSARKIVSLNHNGIDVKVGKSADGKTLGLFAEAAQGFEGVGAAEISNAQKYLDNRAVLDGAFGFMIKAYNNNPITGPLLGSPLIKGLTSPSKIVNTFYNKLGNESVKTVGIERGVPRGITATEIYRLYTNGARQVAFKTHDLMLQANGIKPGVIGSAKAVIKQYQNGLTYTEKQFTDAMAQVIATGESSLSKEVNEGAKLMADFTTQLYTDWQGAMGYTKNALPPKNAIGYMTQMWDLDQLAQRPEEFMKMAINTLREQDQVILSLGEPLRKVEAQIKQLNKKAKTASDSELKVINSEIRSAKKQLGILNEELNTKKRNGEIDPALLEERMMLNDTQFKILEERHKPIDLLESRIAAAEQELNTLSRNEQKAAHAKIKNMKIDRQDLIDQLEKDINPHSPDAPLKNTISPEMLKGFHAARNPKFRKTYHNTDDKRIAGDPRYEYLAEQNREEAARAWYDTLRNMDADQINQRVIGRLTGHSEANVTKQRTILIPQTDIIKNGFMITDPSKQLSMYSKQLSRQIGMQTILKNITKFESVGTPIEVIGQELKKEYDQVFNNILKKHPENTPKRKKLIDKLNKQNKEHEHLIKEAYNTFMGIRPGSEKLLKVDKMLRNFAATTLLRNVPFLQGGEAAGIIFKQKLMPTVIHGTAALVRRVQSKEGRLRYKENSAHAYAGMEIQLSKYVNQMFEPSSSNGIPGSKFEVFTEKTARLGEKLFLTNQITNELQMLSANVTQSRVIGDMYKMAKGKLSQVDKDRLLMNGIDPKDYGKWIKAYEEGGGYKIGGGYESNWYNWKELDLSAQMRRAIHNDIQGSILEAGALDKPFWTRDPITGLPFHFMGYIYAAFNKFTVPLVQSPDASRFMGMALMISYASMIEPLRKWEKGEEFKLDDEATFSQHVVEAIVESGVLGAPVEFAEMVDALFQPAFLDEYRLDKFRRRSFSGIVGGPAGAAVQNVIDVAKMYIDGTINQQGLMKQRNAMGLPIPFYLDWALTRGIKNSSLPETAKDASAWQIWQDYFGRK